MKRKTKTGSEGKKTPSLLARTSQGGKPATERVTVTDPTGRWRSLRRSVDSIDLMHRRRQIDDRQRMAANHYREQEERLRSSIPCTLDMSRSRGGGVGASPTQGKIDASEFLEYAEKLLGRMDSRIVSMVATDGYTIEQAAARLYPARSDGRLAAWVIRHVGQRLREALTVLADDISPIAKSGIKGDRMFDPDQQNNESGKVERGRVAHAVPGKVFESD